MWFWSHKHKLILFFLSNVFFSWKRTTKHKTSSPLTGKLLKLEASQHAPPFLFGLHALPSYPCALTRNIKTNQNALWLIPMLQDLFDFPQHPKNTMQIVNLFPLFHFHCNFFLFLQIKDNIKSLFNLLKSSFTFFDTEKYQMKVNIFDILKHFLCLINRENNVKIL